ncbi:MAG: carbamoyltransferase HypF [Nevskia sp.]|nr:carbamoyltransferase HypF [Nevskia sp.]
MSRPQSVGDSMLLSAELIRVRGLVQGVGFRPTVWRLARRYGLRGSVANDGDGVHIHVCGTASALEAFVVGLRCEAPLLARIDSIERHPAPLLPPDAEFAIAASNSTEVHTGVAPDAATCADCLQEIFDPFARRFRYPFTNCTHCGPRLSIVEAIPYDRATTTMRAFALCPACRAEYTAPDDRRFHAQPIACYACGPRAWLERYDHAPIAVEALTTLDDVDAACTLLQRGHLLAIKGLGGFQIACDASNETTVAALRQKKRREGKPFALMARDLELIQRYCHVDCAEETLLRGPAAPIVLLNRRAETPLLAASVAPGLNTLGFMLPNTPLHHLLLRRMNRPIVLTSGNRASEPQCIDNDDAREKLSGIAEFFLLHNRPIARRVDDSVTRVVLGVPRVLRRARGYAPATLLLPAGFGAAPPLLALGGELKNTFCLLGNGQAVLSHHIGDLEDAATDADYRRALHDYQQLFAQTPTRLAIDLHPEYRSSKLGREMAQQHGMALAEVQHHHAHVAACMAENGIGIDAGPVLGVALDGLGYGDDGTLWGGEFLRADYRGYTRLGTFKPVALLGAAQAVYEPWRNLYAQLMAEMGWPRFVMNYAELELHAYLDAKPRALLDGMLARRINSPLASSCGRLFDAAAAAVGLCRDRVQYEGQAAIEFEALVDAQTLHDEGDQLAYPFTIPRLPGSRLPYIEPHGVWQALLGDLILRTPAPVIAARFHKGLALAIVRMVEQVSVGTGSEAPLRTVALSGGVFQNRVLFEQVERRLTRLGFRVLSHAQVPANDGGLALGQAVIAAARALPAGLSAAA